MDEVERKERGLQSCDLPRLEILNLLMRGKREPSFDFEKELFKVMEEYVNMPSISEELVVEKLYKKEFMLPYLPMLNTFCEAMKWIEDGDLIAADLLKKLVEKTWQPLTKIYRETVEEIKKQCNSIN